MSTRQLLTIMCVAVTLIGGVRQTATAAAPIPGDTGACDYNVGSCHSVCDSPEDYVGEACQEDWDYEICVFEGASCPETSPCEFPSEYKWHCAGRLRT
jgi:hypothetical protein